MALNPRLVLAAGLLALLVGGSVALAAWQLAPAVGDAAPHRVEIVGPDGVALFEGDVQVESASALTLLRAAADKAGLTLEIEEYPGMGAYVRAVGPHRASGPSGWIYEVEKEGRWVGGDRSAAHYPLAEGEALRWKWVGEGAGNPVGEGAGNPA